MIQIKKRNGLIVDYNRDKIANAINGANKEVGPTFKADTELIDIIIRNIELNFKDSDVVSVEDIQDEVELELMAHHKFNLAKKYITYRYNRALIRKANSTDNTILSLIRGQNKELEEENSNKNPLMASTQRDYIAGEVSRDMTRRCILPEYISKAHDDGAIHFHDADYFIQPIFNCCLINIADMLDNGTVMNGKMCESPKSFRVACTVMTQIIATVASNQFGGQSVDISHLGKYLVRSRKRFLKKLRDHMGPVFDTLTQEQIEGIIDTEMKDELESGVQVIQYQINTLMTTNGQAPFVTLFLNIKPGDAYETEIAMIVEEILKQRLQGIKNGEGVYVTPAFPKLIYVLYEHNNLTGGKYDYITHLAAKCTSKRMYPDYISAKKMREIYDGQVFSCMGCRAFLSPWKDENGNYKFEGRFNQGVVSINLPQIGIIANGDEETFWKLLDERLQICFDALMIKHTTLLGTTSDISPIHWQYGAIARLGKGEKIDKYLKGGYSTISLGYIGIYETTKLMKGVSHTDPEGTEFALKLLQYLRDTVNRWKEETNIGFALYGTPAESLCYRFAKIDKERFGEIKDVTDKGYYTNSYHVDVREHIDIFSKLKFESKFQPISSGGFISYGEIPNMSNNLEALESVIKFIYENTPYAEFNTKSDYCHVCGYDGEIMINDDYEWECPVCHNKDKKKMNVTRRTCGYLGENFWNAGKTREIKARVTHL